MTASSKRLSNKINSLSLRACAAGSCMKSSDEMTDQKIKARRSCSRTCKEERSKRQDFANQQYRGPSQNRKCNNCHKWGHFARECPQPRRIRRLQAHSWSQANIITENPEQQSKQQNKEKEDEQIFFDIVMFALNLDRDDAHWYLDSGATVHVTGNQSNLRIVRTNTMHTMVKAIAGQEHEVRGEGTTVVQCGDKTQKVPGVLHVLGVCKNLLSVGTITNRVCIMILIASRYYIMTTRKPTIVVTQGIGDSLTDLYRLTTPSKPSMPPQIGAHLVEQDSAMLWHQRLGCPDFQLLHDLSTKHSIKEIPHIPSDRWFCHERAKEKLHKLPATKESSTRATTKNQLLRVDLCGPFTQTSQGDPQYFLIVIDDFSRMV